MQQILTNFVWGLICAGLVVLLWRRRGKAVGNRKSMEVRATASIEELRSIGMLSVFKAVTKEIVTARDHSLGNLGKRYLEWLVTSRKMAMIFEFDIDFRYDLRDSAFAISEEVPGRYRIEMPKCTYVVNVRNITFYDEQDEKLLPMLLPDMVNKLLPGGFHEEDRNRLMEEARAQAEGLADGLARRLGSEVRTSASRTMEMLAKGFGADSVEVVFPTETQDRAASAPAAPATA